MFKSFGSEVKEIDAKPKSAVLVVVHTLRLTGPIKCSKNKR